MIKYFLGLVFLAISFSVQSQVKINAELNRLLQGKTRFADIREIVENYYRQELQLLRSDDSVQRKNISRQMKFWYRYFLENKNRLTTQGEIDNPARRIVDYLSTPQAANAVAAAYGNWIHVGPNFVANGIGRVNRIAFDPGNPAVMYAGSGGGGLYKTTTAGLSWSSVGSFIPALGIGGVVVSHNNAQEVYVLTGDGDAGGTRYSVGVLKSFDGGNSWIRTGNFPGLDNDMYKGLQLAQDPTNAAVLLAATTKGIFRTTDGGTTWSESFCDGTRGKIVYDVKFKPGSSSTVYCTFRYDTDNGNSVRFAVSTDGGDNFSSSGISYTSPIDNADRITIGVTPANPAYVYLLCGPGYVTTSSNANDTFEGLYRSTNSGQSFSRRSNSPDILCYQDIVNQFANQSTYDLSLAVSPVNPNLVLVGGLVVWRSTDGGSNWDEIVDYYTDIDNSNYIHADVHELKFNPLNGNVYACTDGGVSGSNDNGDNWTRYFSGLGCTMFYRFEPHNEDGDIWGGTQDNGILIKGSSTSTFDTFDGGDGYDVMTDIAPAGNFDDKYWVIKQKIWADGVFDINITPSQIDPDDPAEVWPTLDMSPSNEDVIYAGYRHLYVSYSRGDNWASIPISGVGNEAVPGNWAISTCPTNRKRVYSAGKYAQDAGLFRVDNLDDFLPDVVTDLTDALTAANYPGTNAEITDIAVSTNSSSRLWVTVGGYTANAKVFYSNDGGVNFVNISGSLPNLPVSCITADDNDNVYIGTDIGVYYKGAGDNDWTPFYNGLPRVQVTQLEILNLGLGVYLLYASTYGRGIWVSDIYSTCEANLTVNQGLQGQNFYQAGNINSTSVLSGVAGTNVFFKAATQVLLQPGLEVKAGAELKAYIAACNAGGVPYRAIVGDSVVDFKKDIPSAKSYGLVSNAVGNGNAVQVELSINRPGNFTIRVYDADARAYLSSANKSFQTGRNNCVVSLDPAWGKNLRIDLFNSENTLIHYMDIERK